MYHEVNPHDMGITLVLPLQAAGLREMMFLMMLFMAVLMAASITSAALFSTYRSRFSMPGIDAGASRDIGGASLGALDRATPDSARAMLNVRESTRKRSSFRGRQEAGEKEAVRERHPLPTVSEVETWRFVLGFVAAVGLGAVAFTFGDVSFGSELVLSLVGLVIFSLGTVLFLGGFSSFEIYHTVRETPTKDAAEISQGETVEMYGKVTVSDHGTHKAPFTDEECVVCEYEIIEKDVDDEVIDSGTAGVPFYVEDSTGRVLVDPEKAKLMVGLDTQTEVESEEPPSEITGGYVDIGVNEVESEYRERYVKPGESVYVYGDAITSDEHGVVIGRQNEETLLMISDSSEGELRKSLLSKAVSRGAAGVFLMSVGMGVVFWLSGFSVNSLITWL